MSKKVIGVIYKDLTTYLDGYEVNLSPGTILNFKGGEMPIAPKGVLIVSELELSVNKFKKLATTLIQNKLLKPTAKTFRLDKILKLEQHKKNTPKKAKAKKSK